MNRQCRQLGFTTVELVACIVIIGIISVVVAPRLIGNDAIAGRTYSYEVAAALREAQSVAVASGCEVAMTVNASDYQAQQRSVLNNTCNPVGGWTVNVMRADGSALAGTAPNGLAPNNATRIVFGAQGQVTSAAPPPIDIDTYRLRIDPVSGLVTLP
jgi:MSHA pilin protein MshC